MNLSGKKILICEEALIDYNGHFFTWIRAIRKMHIDVGAEVFVAGNCSVVPDVRKELRVLPVYTINSWDQTISSKWPAWRKYVRVFAQNWRIFLQTRKALIQSGPVDMLFFTAVRVHHMVGLRALCAWGLGRRFKRLTCFLLISQAEYNADFTAYSFPKQTQLLAWVLRSFRSLARRGDVILAGDSQITCSEYEKFADVPMTVFPSPGGDWLHASTASKSSEDGPVFSIFGSSVWEKGIDTFQDAIVQFLDRYPNSSARFILQWGFPCIGPDGQTVSISERLRTDPRVSLFERRLTDSEYTELFASTDIIVLPYRRNTYFNRLSGVAVEAACSGKPMIVTKDTWLDWAMREFGSGVSFPEDNAEALCEAIADCCDKWPQLQALAESRRETALHYNSSDKYLSLLWDRQPGWDRAGDAKSGTNTITSQRRNDGGHRPVVGIVSLYEWLTEWDNYGTLLQNYALQVTLKRLGYQTFWIRTGSDKQVDYVRKAINVLSQLVYSPKELILHIGDLINANIFQRRANRKQKQALENFNRNHPRYFSDFIRKNIPCSDHEFSPATIRASSPQADAYIVGSDNIWSRVTNASFLNFGPVSSTRVAYAVSAPWTILSKYWYRKAKPLISRIQFLSTREREGMEVCKRLGRPDAIQVLDPTLLLKRDDYRGVAVAGAQRSERKAPFVLCYFLNISALTDLPWGDIRDLAAKRSLNLSVVPLQGTELVIPEQYIYAPSPGEWIDAFDKADCVVTNSYHGVIFAIVMQKQFLVTSQSKSQDRGGERIPNLLNLLGLHERFYRVSGKEDMDAQMAQLIDWVEVDKLLNVKRQKSVEFLKTALSNV